MKKLLLTICIVSASDLSYAQTARIEFNNWSGTNLVLCQGNSRCSLPVGTSLIEIQREGFILSQDWTTNSQFTNFDVGTQVAKLKVDAYRGPAGELTAETQEQYGYLKLFMWGFSISGVMALSGLCYRLMFRVNDAATSEL